MVGVMLGVKVLVKMVPVWVAVKDSVGVPVELGVLVTVGVLVGKVQ